MSTTVGNRIDALRSCVTTALGLVHAAKGLDDTQLGGSTVDAHDLIVEAERVLLVAAEPKKRKGRRDAAVGGVAMWVERADEKHLAGVWTRWEVMNAGEGRWEADLERAEPQ